MKSTASTAAHRDAVPGGFSGSPRALSVRLAFESHRPGERPPGAALPALAVLGRSNVGKSSLLNVLLGTRVARVSQTPGRTQALYWYRVDDRLDVVDCPGYGYAKASREKRRVFSDMLDTLLTAESPAGVSALLLVDGRLSPQESDRSMALFLAEAGVPAVVAATKWDAVRPAARARQLRDLAAEYQTPDRPLLPVSAETGENIRDLWRLISSAGGSRPDIRTRRSQTHATPKSSGR